MAKVLVYQRPSAEAAMEWLGLHQVDVMPAKSVHDISVAGVEFRIKHWPNGDQMWVHRGVVPDSFKSASTFLRKEEVTDGA